ncbi:MAG: hypothetical protein ACI9CA_001705 [Natronomonas sp.]|jgi:hypothetical protein
MTRDELAAFEDDLLESVGAEVGAGRLAALAREHQAGVRDRPGVDNIVYEWRRQLPGDPLVLRTTAVYVLALPGGVWAEFLDELGVNGREAEALRRLHDRQAGRLVDSADEHATLVLVRP